MRPPPPDAVEPECKHHQMIFQKYPLSVLDRDRYLENTKYEKKEYFFIINLFRRMYLVL